MRVVRDLRVWETLPRLTPEFHAVLIAVLIRCKGRKAPGPSCPGGQRHRDYSLGVRALMVKGTRARCRSLVLGRTQAVRFGLVSLFSS
jgi:hypothetical protein